MTKNETQGQQLFMALLSNFNSGADAVISLFNEDAVIEYPYAPSIGVAARQDKEAYRKHLEGGLKNMPDLQFSNIRVYPLQKEGAYWAEAHGETTILSTGLLYQQDYVMYFILKDNKFSFYREYWNPLPGMKAFGGDKGTQEMFNTNDK